MLNYIKGEGYRITHSRGMYVAAGIASGLLVLMNLVLYISNQNITNFPYGLMSFSLNNLIANLQILFISGFVVAALLFGDERKNGTLKNVVAKDTYFYRKMWCQYRHSSLLYGSYPGLLRGKCLSAAGWSRGRAFGKDGRGNRSGNAQCLCVCDSGCGFTHPF